MSAERTDGRRPSLRDSQRSSTRERILEATAELVEAEGTVDVPLTGVAARAGIGERTLYRYFPTKLDLIVALFGWMTGGVGDLPPATDPDGLLDRAATFFAAYDSHPEIVRAMSAGRTADTRVQRSEQRRDAVRTALAAELEGVPEPRRTQVLAAVHLLTSSDAFLHARDFWALDGDGMSAMARWAVHALLDGMDRP